MKRSIYEIWEDNADALEVISRYLVYYSDRITKELVEDVSEDAHVSKEYAFYVLLCAVCGIDEERSEKEKVLAREYLLPSVHLLDRKDFIENTYYKNIRIPEKSCGNWSIRTEHYAPYQAFVCRDLIIDEALKEVPCLGFFEEEFPYPAVLEHENEWMTITPNEVATMQGAIDTVSGKVVTFGLGLGYFAYMASEKEEVVDVTVVERDPDVIRLFKKEILPQFAHAEKIHIIQEEAFAYVNGPMRKECYDYAFVDIWHDVSDGVLPYCRMKRLEKTNPKTTFLYWIEESLISNLRFQVASVLFGLGGTPAIEEFLKENQIGQREEEKKRCLEKEFLQQMAKELTL